MATAVFKKDVNVGYLFNEPTYDSYRSYNSRADPESSIGRVLI